MPIERGGQKPTPSVGIGDGSNGYAFTVMGRAPVTETGDTMPAGGFRASAPVTEIGDKVAGVGVVYTGVTMIGLNGSGLNGSGVGVPIVAMLVTPVVGDDAEVMVTLEIIMPVEVMELPEDIMPVNVIVPPEDIVPVDVMVPPEDIVPVNVIPVAEPELTVVVIVPSPTAGVAPGLRLTERLIPAGICRTLRPCDAAAEFVWFARIAAMPERPVLVAAIDADADGLLPITTVMGTDAGGARSSPRLGREVLARVLAPTPLRRAWTQCVNCWPVGSVWRIDSNSAVTR